MVQRDQWDTYQGPKKNFFKFAAPRRTRPQSPRASGILSIPVKEVSLGSPRVGTVHVQAPTPHTPPLPAYFGQFSHHCGLLNHQLLGNGLQSSLRTPRIGACGVGDYPTPDLSRRASEGRSAPEKSVQFGPDGAPFPSKTSITRGPPVVAVAVSLDPILPQR